MKDRYLTDCFLYSKHLARKLEVSYFWGEFGALVIAWIKGDNFGYT